ncbi:2190_t:CDS:2 [Cetraspora pellucida]|uniref:2190_t:CDS:1 n=1 Tax=Cetraspora pellucida TaxID=1433469 RepID=A0A9N9F4U0_9GLOM|nr:2190_t:CDS:2 [Cetraspora pellucida]
MAKPDLSDLFYYIKPQEQTNHTSLSQGTASDLSENIGPNLNDFDLTAIYDRFVRPYKEKGVERDPTYFPYINNLPGKVKIIPDRSFRKFFENKNKRKWGKKYPPEDYPLDAKTIENNMLNLLKPGQIPGVTSSTATLDGDDRTHEKKKKKKHKHENNYDVDRKRKHKHDKDHRKGSHDRIINQNDIIK